MHKVLLQINVSANWGSTGKIAESIGQFALTNGWRSYIAFSRCNFDSKLEVIKIGGKLAIILHALWARFFDMAGRGSYFQTKRLIRKIKQIRPTIIHLHNIHGYVINYKLLFEYLNTTDIKIVWTFHDFWAITGHCAHFIAQNCWEWKKECRNCQYNFLYPAALISLSAKNFQTKKRLFLQNRNLHVVAVSEWVKHLTNQSFLCGCDIRVIPNGIDLSVFHPTTMSDAILDQRLKGKFVILAVATQWRVGKGYEDYILMSALLQEDEVIVLVGVSDKQMHSLPDNIIGIPEINSKNELAALYTRSDVVMSLSESETFGLTIIEGYACGTPAVVYDNTALPSLVTPLTGYVVPNKDWNKAYYASKCIKKHGKQVYSQHCIEMVQRNYDVKSNLKRYMSLYDELIGHTNSL